jgi:hypothetical protein
MKGFAGAREARDQPDPHSAVLILFPDYLGGHVVQVEAQAVIEASGQRGAGHIGDELPDALNVARSPQYGAVDVGRWPTKPVSGQ